MKVRITPLHCLRCGHAWFPRSNDVRICPRCKTARWDEPRTTRSSHSSPTVSSAAQIRSSSGETLLESLRREQAKILRICRAHGARNVRVFGSAARAEETATSDVDFLMDFERGRSLVDLAGLEIDLEHLIGRPVDVGEVASLHPLIRKKVLEEAVPL